MRGGARDLIFLTFARALLVRLGLDDARLRIARLTPPRPHAGLTFALTEKPETVAPVRLDPDLATDLARTWAFLTGAASTPPADPALRHALDIVQSRHPVPPGSLDVFEARVLAAVGETFTRAVRPIADALVAGYDLGDPVGELVLFAALKRLGTRGLVELEGSGSTLRDTRARLTPAGRAARTTGKA